ncbi:MAG: hypothetical protein HY975_00370 [Candidatus Kerfeldbacteria bacterium]|nr:hypothetical protein [Candidatus Kerfeldbacteria bacterium]
MRKVLLSAVALAVVGGMLVPAMSEAKSKPKFSNPVAIDGHGDRNGIGKFNSENKEKKRRVVSGIVTAVSTTSITVEVGVSQSDKNTNSSNANTNTTVTKKTFTFAVDSNTKVIRKFKGTASITEVMVGDRVQVWATSLTNGTAKLIWDKSIWWAEVRGKISNINDTAKTFTLTITKNKVEFTTTVKANDLTTYWQDGVAKTWDDLANGQTVVVRGTWDSVNSQFLARKITIKL